MGALQESRCKARTPAGVGPWRRDAQRYGFRGLTLGRPLNGTLSFSSLRGDGVDKSQVAEVRAILCPVRPVVVAPRGAGRGGHGGGFRGGGGGGGETPAQNSCSRLRGFPWAPRHLPWPHACPPGTVQLMAGSCRSTGHTPTEVVPLGDLGFFFFFFFDCKMELTVAFPEEEWED